jgi:transcription elongation factor Elf1
MESSAIRRLIRTVLIDKVKVFFCISCNMQKQNQQLVQKKKHITKLNFIQYPNRFMQNTKQRKLPGM